jgi:phage-related protein
MMATIGNLAVKLGLDSSKFDKGVKNVESKSGKMKSGLKTVGMVAGGLVAGIAAAGGAAFALGKKVGDLADEILDLEAITGMTTDSIQEWRKVTEVAGVSQDAMTNASQKLTRNLDTMRLESNKGNKALEQLGYSLDDIKNMSADERMDTLTKALSGVEDVTERARLGTDIFAGSWKEIAPVVSLGAEAMDKAKESANIIDKDKLEMANQFRITIADMKERVGFLFMELAIKLIPILQAFFDWINQYMPQIKEIAGQVFGFIKDAVGVLSSFWKENNDSMKNNVMDNFNQIKEFIMPLIQEIVQFIQEKLEVLKQFWKENGEQIMQAVENVFTFIKKTIEFLMPIITKYIETAWKIISGVFDGALNIIMGLIKTFAGLLTGDWEKMGEGLKQIWDGLWGAIETILKGVWDNLSFVFSYLREKIAGWFEGLKDSALDWGKNMIQGFIDGIKAMGSQVANAAKGVVDQAADYIKFWSPAKKGEGRFITHWGENMIDGFLDGVKNAMPGVASTFKKVIPNMDMALTPSMASGMSNISNTTTNQFNFTGPINVRSDSDIKGIARELDHLQKIKSRGSGVNG